ncbi:DNA polymerase alpha-primase complex, polymerase-associated subunit B [Trachipleistophora hominis]|uniref:DNA polymerase alpha subunit B n=1 Tax=Trachipleistophora hominis TaxID=72359 RepID=L7JY60_TRAHO|nr:DNA polymerase alpha-primase complex, polymerase-associated subunit B [Trachipleistophora hominis]
MIYHFRLCLKNPYDQKLRLIRFVFGWMIFCTLGFGMSFDELVINSLRKQNTQRNVETVVLLQYQPKNLFYLRKEEDYNFIKHRLLFMKSGYIELLELQDFSSINTVSVTDIIILGFIITIGEKVFVFNNTDESNDTLVELNLSEMDRYSLFPGQVVAIRGRNLNGNEIIVQEIYDSPVLPVNFFDEGDRGNNLKDNNFSVCFISGPFNNNVKPDEINSTDIYDRLFLSLDSIMTIDASYLVVLGPFIESRFLNSCLDLERVKDIFMAKMNTWINKKPFRKIITVPSTEDVHTLGMYPCASIDDGQNASFINLSNPTQFYIGDVLFSVCTYDILLHMSSTEIFFDINENVSLPESEISHRLDNIPKINPNSLDSCTPKVPKKSKRIERLSAHMIYQRSFLPCFPPRNIVSINRPECFDMNIAPDFFIISSKLKTFIQKDKGPFTVVNIGCQPNISNKQVLRITVNNRDSSSEERFNAVFEKYNK